MAALPISLTPQKDCKVQEITMAPSRNHQLHSSTEIPMAGSSQLEQGVLCTIARTTTANLSLRSTGTIHLWKT